MSANHFLLACLLALLILLAYACSTHGGQKGSFGVGGPYNIGLPDSPRFFPFRMSKNWVSAWDTDGRCLAACRDDGCAVSCR